MPFVGSAECSVGISYHLSHEEVDEFGWRRMRDVPLASGLCISRICKALVRWHSTKEEHERAKETQKASLNFIVDQSLRACVSAVLR
jgi:hypothetical protein